MARPETLRQGYCDAGVSMRELIVEGLLIDADWGLNCRSVTDDDWVVLVVLRSTIGSPR